MPVSAKHKPQPSKNNPLSKLERRERFFGLRFSIQTIGLIIIAVSSGCLPQNPDVCQSSCLIMLNPSQQEADPTMMKASGYYSNHAPALASDLTNYYADVSDGVPHRRVLHTT